MGLDVREIGDVDEGVVERGEDACYAEDELAYREFVVSMRSCSCV